MRVTKTRIGMFAIASLMASVTIAAAADFGPVYKGPRPAVVVNDWSGFYVGAHAGWGWGRDPFTKEFPPGVAMDSVLFDIPGVTVSNVNSNGFVGGFHAGLNQQWGNWVGGLEFDLSGTGIKGSTSNSSTRLFVPLCPVDAVCLPATATQSASVADKFELLGSARARLGFLATPNLLLYGTGGLGWTRLTQTSADIVSTTGIAEVIGGQSLTSTPSWRFGWVAGVGGETKLFNSNNWLFRVEYLHYDFGNSGSYSETSTNLYDGGGYESSNFTSGRLTLDVVRAGISYKFGGPTY